MEPATDAIAQRWAAIRQQNLDTQNEAAIPETKYRHIAAPAQSANTLIEVFDNTSPRFKFGIRELDLITRGCDPGEFTLLVGYCMTPTHEVLSDRGWLTHDQVNVGDNLWTVNPTTGKGEWDVCRKINTFDHNGPLNHLIGRNIDALVTDNHRWPVGSQWKTARSDMSLTMKETTTLNTSDRIPCARPGIEPEREIHSDEFVRIAGWVFTEGNYELRSQRVHIYQSPSANMAHCTSIEADLNELGWNYSIYSRVREDQFGVKRENNYGISAKDSTVLRKMFPNKMVTSSFVDELTVRQRRILIDTLINGDGYIANTAGIRRYATSQKEEADAVSHLFASAGVGFSVREKKQTTPLGTVLIYLFTERTSTDVYYNRIKHNQQHYSGVVWCPTTDNGIILVRNNGRVFYTGNSHSGKTQILLNAICNQPDEPILFFSYDDPAEMVLLKLVCIAEQTSAVQLERELRAGNQETRELLKCHARTTFRNLVIVDEPVPLDAMGDAVAEAQHWFEKPLRAIFLDYLKLLPSEDEYANEYQNVMRKAYQLKMWAKDQSAPLLVIHQGTRSGAKPGHPITLTSGAFGGEEYANLVIGCRRKRDNDTLEPWERQRHQDTITAHVVKNKRPPCKITPPEGIDLHIDATTGLIRPLSDDDFYLNDTTVEAEQESFDGGEPF